MDKPTTVLQICLTAFADITAAVTHDLKNCLAVINETGGLLDDFANMYEEDGVPASQVKKGTNVIGTQIARADTIIKNLNMFAHSGDVVVASANLAELLANMVLLTSRRATSAQVNVHVCCPGDIPFTSQLLVFETLLFRLLYHLYDEAKEESSVEITAEQEGDSIIIRFNNKSATITVPDFPRREEHLLVDSLGGTLDRENILLTLTCPVNAPNN